MTTIRACTALAAAILAGATAAMLAVTVAPTPAFADPPAKPATDKKADKPAAPAPKTDKTDKTEKTEKTEKKEVVSDADAKRFSDFFDKLVTIVVTTQEDCVKMAAGVNGHIDASQALINEMNSPKNKDKELPPAVKERIQKKAREELTPAIIKKCSQDKGVEAAFNRMGAGSGK
ncbi:MAG TPA: hypothetical protein VHT91_31115 [Kofleriaceae bacterium]|jgi:hypothetical protein|nr:hypothetical protein [Kofleriaceae bacterium]